jgi:hypothetical protein
MGIFSEYLEQNLDWPSLVSKRKEQLSEISRLRGGRAVLTFAAALTKQAPIQIDYDDRIHFVDQISNLSGDKIDIILETPGGIAEVVEDLVEHTRSKFSEVAIIIPGYAKSAGTIMAMAGDEILMDSTSALGPIDAQMFQNNKRFSAHAFLEGLDKIKAEVTSMGVLNRAYVPMLQLLSPGEIQECENAMAFSQALVTDWLSKYKFKFWNIHSSTGLQVTEAEKKERAAEIAKILCDHGRWLTHGRSITIEDLTDMGLKITDYSRNAELAEAIHRYYTLLKMSFDKTMIYKIYETPTSQLYKFASPPGIPLLPQTPDHMVIDLECPTCKTKSKIQANLKEGIALKDGAINFPKDNLFICPTCKNRIDLSSFRGQLESQTRKKVI